MRTRGPILTLLAVVVLALILLAVNLTTNTGDSATSDTTAGAPADTAAQAAPVEPAAPAAPAAPAPPPGAPEAGADTAFPAQATYTGKTSGRKVGEADVAIAIQNGKASAYLCDGKQLESWLDGQAQGSALELTGKNDSRLDGTLAGGTLSGTVTVGGLTWQFSATPGKGPAGLYRARNSDVDAGWIVRDDGSQTGVQNVNGQPAAAPALDPAAGSAVIGGTTLPVATIRGGDAASVGR